MNCQVSSPTGHHRRLCFLGNNARVQLDKIWMFYGESVLISFLQSSPLTVESAKLIGDIWITIDLLECVVLLQTEKLPKLVQTSAIPGPRLLHA